MEKNDNKSPCKQAALNTNIIWAKTADNNGPPYIENQLTVWNVGMNPNGGCNNDTDLVPMDIVDDPTQ